MSIIFMPIGKVQTPVITSGIKHNSTNTNQDTPPEARRDKVLNDKYNHDFAIFIGIILIAVALGILIMMWIKK